METIGKMTTFFALMAFALGIFIGYLKPVKKDESEEGEVIQKLTKGFVLILVKAGFFLFMGWIEFFYVS